MRDAALVRLFVRFRERGDGRALAAVFDATAPDLRAVAARLVGPGDADDLVQLTFLRAMQRAAAFDASLELRAWLWGILWREAAKHRRCAARRPDAERLAGREASDPADAAARAEVPAAVLEALARIPARDREVIEPVLFGGEPACDVAARLGRPANTVRVQLRRGLARLRRALPRGVFGLAAVLGWRARGASELDAVRRTILAHASANAPSQLGVWAVAVQASATSAPVVWGASACALAALALAPVQLLTIERLTNERLTSQGTETAMKTTHLLALPLALGAVAPGLAQDPGPREPVPVAQSAVQARSAELDALVAQLLETAHGGGAEADAAWNALLAAKRRIADAEARRLRATRVEAGPWLAKAQEWAEGVSQLADPARRAAALDAIDAALRSADPDARIAACRALARLGDVKFDKGALRAPVLAIAREASGEERVTALYALYATEHRPEDLELALALVDDPSERAQQAASHLLFLHSGGELTGRVGDAVLRLFENEEVHTLREVLRGLWGARVSPAIEARLLALSEPKSPSRHDAIYFGLSTLQDKSRAVVDRLVAVLADPDPNDWSRALWGLGHGVPAEHGHVVVAAMHALFEARTDAGTQADALLLVGQYGGADDAAWLHAIAADERRPEHVRTAARRALAQLERR